MQLSFDQALRGARAVAGITQTELARRSYVSVSAIRLLEAGRVKPRRVTIIALGAALGLDFVALLPEEMRTGLCAEKAQDSK